ncbi:heme ABC transporter ATP-binding protein [Rubellicoccus peritrichatus]|uniref:Heme ABC transporter ATP-binding protein n=1 Tax=Rubellicoccus peritrichatus TaxID=3080537 RepID=A0AAQ3LDW3_9BACT|nr:heme ABC transporter ATP-binding protein [Puniceicoccus sp. CR14]WOO42639.1 heme ABC transporter ATP-binding protein [Puniceicoccus sp. CR14]
MIAAKNISYAYGTKQVLDDVSLSIEAGTITAIIGPNGAGKSTLLNIMTGAIEASSGSILLDEKSLKSFGAADLACRRAVLPQSSKLGFNFTVREVVEMGRMPHLDRHEKDSGVDIVGLAMEATDISALEERHYLTLSGGERQRVDLARVLAQIWPDKESGSTAYLFLDEPTNNLDISHQHAVLEAGKKMASQGLGVCCVLHDLNLALNYTDCTLLLKQGRVFAQGKTEETMTRKILGEVFGVDVSVIEHEGRKVIATQPQENSI